MRNEENINNNIEFYIQGVRDTCENLQRTIYANLEQDIKDKIFQSGLTQGKEESLEELEEELKDKIQAELEDEIVEKFSSEWFDDGFSEGEQSGHENGLSEGRIEGYRQFFNVVGPDVLDLINILKELSKLSRNTKIENNDIINIIEQINTAVFNVETSLRTNYCEEFYNIARRAKSGISDI